MPNLSVVIFQRPNRLNFLTDCRSASCRKKDHFRSRMAENEVADPSPIMTLCNGVAAVATWRGAAGFVVPMPTFAAPCYSHLFRLATAVSEKFHI